MRQIDEVRVSVAADIFQTFTLNVGSDEIHGNPVPCQIASSYTGNLLNIFVTEECASAEFPSYDLVSLIADLCGIKDPNHCSLLYTALSSSSMRSIYSTFIQQGLHVKEIVFGMPQRLVSSSMAH